MDRCAYRIGQTKDDSALSSLTGHHPDIKLSHGMSDRVGMTWRQRCLFRHRLAAIGPIDMKGGQVDQQARNVVECLQEMDGSFDVDPKGCDRVPFALDFVEGSQVYDGLDPFPDPAQGLGTGQVTRPYLDSLNP